MDAIQLIQSHPSYKKNIKDISHQQKWTRYLRVLDLESDIRKAIKTFNLTTKVKNPAGRPNLHYAECRESTCEDCSQHDQCGGRCVCMTVDYNMRQAHLILDQIEESNRPNYLQRLLSCFRN